MDLLDIIPRIAFVVFFFGFSIFIHEFGHMIAAIWRGLHVEKFSIGFGPRICGFKYKNIDFILSWLPLGGYVALPQMEPGQAEDLQDKDGNPLKGVTALDKIIVAVAGPFFNILFALFLSIIIWQVGKKVPAPITSIAASSVLEKSAAGNAGLEDGDIINRINGETFAHSDTVQMLLFTQTQTRLQGTKVDGSELDITYKAPVNPLLDSLPEHGWYPYPITEPFIKQIVAPKGPGALAGLQKGDLIKEIDGIAMPHSYAIVTYLRKKSDQEVNLTVVRDNAELNIQLTPKVSREVDLGIIFNDDLVINHIVPGSPAFDSELATNDKLLSYDGKKITDAKSFWNSFAEESKSETSLQVLRGDKTITVNIPLSIKTRGLMGVAFAGNMIEGHPTPQEQFGRVIAGTVRTFTALTDEKSPIGIKHMSGFLGIGDAIFKYTQLGYMTALGFIVMINISLAIFNLLPVPVLDGGHICIAIIEKITKRPLSAAILQPVMLVFMITLFGLMIYVTGHDTRRLAKEQYYKVEVTPTKPNQHA